MAKTGKQQEQDGDLVKSFVAIRIALGMLGLVLPPLLLISAWATSEPMRSSISAYYYSSGREILTGTLFAMAVFLWSYRGYKDDGAVFPSDQLVSHIAAAAVLVVAFVPTGDDRVTDQTCTFVECLIRRASPAAPTSVHLTAAALFFLMLSVFCLINFRRAAGTVPDAEKRAKNRVFLVCGWTILACLLLLGLRAYAYAKASPEGQVAMQASPLVFYLESAAVWSFAVAWLTKGEVYRLVPGGKPKV